MLDTGIDDMKGRPVDWNEVSMNIWFAKVHYSVRINIRGTYVSHFYICKDEKDTQQISDGSERLEFCFVQYHYILGAGELPIDKMDDALNWLRLQWQRTAVDAGSLTSVKVYCLVPIDSIRKLVQTARSSDIISQGFRRDERPEAEQAFSTRAKDWIRHVFFIIQYFVDQVKYLAMKKANSAGQQKKMRLLVFRHPINPIAAKQTIACSRSYQSNCLGYKFWESDRLNTISQNIQSNFCQFLLFKGIRL